MSLLASFIFNLWIFLYLHWLQSIVAYINHSIRKQSRICIIPCITVGLALQAQLVLGLSCLFVLIFQLLPSVIHVLFQLPVEDSWPYFRLQQIWLHLDLFDWISITVWTFGSSFHWTFHILLFFWGHYLAQMNYLAWGCVSDRLRKLIQRIVLLSVSTRGWCSH